MCVCVQSPEWQQKSKLDLVLFKGQCVGSLELLAFHTGNTEWTERTKKGGKGEGRGEKCTFTSKKVNDYNHLSLVRERGSTGVHLGTSI